MTSITKNIVKHMFFSYTGTCMGVLRQRYNSNINNSVGIVTLDAIQPIPEPLISRANVRVFLILIFVMPYVMPIFKLLQ